MLLKNKINHNVYKYHHSASRYGYCRVGLIGTYEPYKGIFGEGYIRRNGCHNGSTQYESITYYIKESSKPFIPKDCVKVYTPTHPDKKGLSIYVNKNDLSQIGLDTLSPAVMQFNDSDVIIRIKEIASQNHFGGKKLAFLKANAIKYSYGYVLSIKNGRDFLRMFK